MTDKAGKPYWEALWAETEIPTVVDPRVPGRRNYVNRRLDAYFRQVFASIKTAEKRLLEVGCARSAWLPYFAKEFGFKICGLDYSELGCRQEQEQLASSGVDGDIVCADFFTPPKELCGAFDVVVSFGVVEHFENTAACLSAFTEFLKPGGLLFTLVPNTLGTVGWLFNRMNPAVYAMHVPLRPTELRRAHERAGLQVVRSHYFLSTSFGVVNLSNLEAGQFKTRLKQFLLDNLSRLSKLIWIVESYTWEFPATKLFSPYIVCVARK
ncbi:MAG: class I SAM-dependent methyltransferase [Acidobacteria bacterium]|nr:class I SAM-dependent methyltransferase [Acidobacteriota bacterium]MBI3656810.1 class I SAM-dependent methyltransferase [Acidobacteriota bacterium]